MLKTSWLRNKQVGVLGLGLSGIACVRFLARLDSCLGCQVFAFDQSTGLTPELPANVPLTTGDLQQVNWKTLDILVVSPGISVNSSVVLQAKNAGLEIIGDIEVFARCNHKPVIAITGSNGKSTVTTLAREMLQCAGINAVMGGNIGVPVLELLTDEFDVAVLELSSFQLETTYSLSPQVATVLNVTPDHLDRYPDFSSYCDAKARVYHNAQHGVINQDDPNTSVDAIATTTFGEQGDFSLSADGQFLCHRDKIWLSFTDCQLKGHHNALNIQAAAALAMQLGVTLEQIAPAAKAYQALPHRCRLISSWGGVDWVDDSKATNVGAAISAIKSLSWQHDNQLLLIAGGDAKGGDLSLLKPYIEQYVDHLLVIGAASQQLLELYPQAHSVESLKQAVKLATRLVQSGDLVLLSPACASIDMFENYQHRGEVFLAAIEALDE